MRQKEKRLQRIITPVDSGENAQGVDGLVGDRGVFKDGGKGILQPLLELEERSPSDVFGRQAVVVV